MDKMPFKNEIMTMLAEGKKPKAVRAKLGQLYKDDELASAIGTLNHLIASDAAKSTAKKGSVGSKPGAIKGIA